MEIIASYTANLNVKLQCSGCDSSIKSEQAYLFIIIISAKYKFVLHLLKEDGLSQSVLMYLFASFLPLRYCFEETTRFDVKALFATGPVSHLIKPGHITKEF